MGVKLNEDGKMESEVERRIRTTMQAVGVMKKVYEISRGANVVVFKAGASSKGDGKVQDAGSGDEGAEGDCWCV